MKRTGAVITAFCMGLAMSWGLGCAAGGGGGGGSTQPPVVNPDEDSDRPVVDDPDDAPDGDDVDPDGGQIDGDDRPDDDGPVVRDGAVVKTQIVAGVNGKLDTGDDLIVYGIDLAPVNSDQPPGIHYIFPSQSDSRTAAGRTIPNSDRLFGVDDFKVAGRKVAVVRGTRAVAIFDVDKESLVDISLADLTLDSVGGEPHNPGQMTSDGPFIAAINNVAGNLFGSTTVAVIDVSGDEPAVLDFPRPEDFGDIDDFDQVAVDAESRRVIGLGLGNLYLYDIDRPGSLPIKFDFGSGFITGTVSNAVPIRFDGSHVIFHNDPSLEDPAVSLLNVEDGTVTQFDDNPTDSAAPVALAGGSFGYFVFRVAIDREEGSFKINVFRGAIGRISDAPSATLASQVDLYGPRPTIVDEPGSGQDVCFGDGKLVGYGSMQCITPDGRLWFMAGVGAVDERFDYVQVSRGGAFQDIPDPERTTYTGSLMGTDLVCSADIMAFRGLREIDDVVACGTTLNQVISFIRLDEFEP